MKVRTGSLNRQSLDWAVALVLSQAEYDQFRGDEPWSPSERWSQGGPIVRSFRIDLLHCQNGSGRHETLAQVRDANDVTGTLLAQAWGCHGEGPELDLIAAMRCLVLLKKGEEIDVPDDLLEAEAAPA